MGCGCKNKTNSNTAQVTKSRTNEQVQQAIKKTVEKYYLKK